MRALVLLVMVLCVSPAAGSSQTRAVSGTVRGGDGAAVPEALLRFSVARDTIRVTTDARGTFRVVLQGSAPVRLRVEHVGFEPWERLLTAADLDRPLDVVLETAVVQLSAIGVEARTATERVRDRPMAAAAVDARDVTLQTSAAADVVGRAAGVRVRQSGGLGSTSLISIHGLAGRQVRTFVDGLPQEFLGAAGSMAALSLGRLDRIEVYKGVVPVELGGDALGGALNFVTAVDPGQAHIAVGGGSFGGRRGEVSARTAGGRWEAALTGAHAAARNDYRIDATIPDEFNHPQPVRVRRFHDRFRVDRATAELALRPGGGYGTFRLRGFGAAQYKELQHAAVMAQPYGQATTRERSRGAVLGWERGSPRLHVNAEIGGSHLRSQFLDTTLNVYDWNGAVIRRRDYGGEISSSRNDLVLNTRNVLGRVHAAVPAGPGLLRLHALHLGFKRTGHDSIAAGYYGLDPFRHPSGLDRTVVGLAWESSWRDAPIRLEFAGKHYRYAARGFTLQGIEFRPVPTRRDSRNGLLAAAGWSPLSALTLKASWEWATRLPDAHEVLGDFSMMRPNPELKPESSQNANLGVQFARGALRAEATGFYRNTSNIVFLRTSQFYSIHENLLEARTMGVEVALEAEPLPFVAVRGSGTWQDVRNRSPQGQSSSVADRYYNARLPNVPVLFGNAQLTVRDPQQRPGSDTRAWWSVSYVREFFLHWEVDGRRDSKAVVPRQQVHNVGFTRELAAGRIRVNAELQNVFDARTYDVFSVPRPGRAVQVSARALLVTRKPSPARGAVLPPDGSRRP